MIRHKLTRFALLIILMSFNTGALKAQLEANVWPMADSGVINWQGGKYPKPSKTLGMIATEGTGAICDSLGNLVLYSNGQDLFSGTGKKLNIGFKLRANPSTTQGVLILKHPESAIYHIFTNCDYSDTMGLYLTRLELVGDSAVFMDKAKRILNTASEGINAINHQNGRDIWVVTHSGKGDTFFTFLILNEGIHNCVRKFRSSINLIIPGSNIWIAPNGKFAGLEGFYASAKVAQSIFLFNNQLSALNYQINLNSENWGLAFTHEGEYFYSFISDGRIIRRSTNIWDKTAINNSTQFIYNKTDKQNRVPRIGYNNIAVFPQYNKNYFGVVTNCADDNIANVKYIDTGIKFTKAKCTIGNFNTNQSYFYTPAINYKYKQDCNTNEFLFWGVDTFAANAYRWEIKKGNSISKYNTKSLNHQFTDTGIWQVKYVATNGSRTDSVSKDIEIFPILKSGFLGKDIGYCGNALPLAVQGPLGMNCYTWQKPHGIETYVDHIAADTAGMYILETCNPVFCTYKDTLLVYEKAEPDAPQISRIGDSLYVTNPEPGVAYHWFKANVFTNSVGPAYKVTDTAWYKVRGVAPINCIGPFDSINVKTLQNRVSLQPSIVFYPNPVMDDVFLQHVPLEAKILLRDVTGRLVYETVAKQSELQIALTQLPAGNYQLTIETTDQRAVYNVVKL